MLLWCTCDIDNYLVSCLWEINGLLFILFHLSFFFFIHVFCSLWQTHSYVFIRKYTFTIRFCDFGNSFKVFWYIMQCCILAQTSNGWQFSTWQTMVIPSTYSYNLLDFSFSDFGLDDDDTLKASIRMFIDLNLLERFRINYEVCSTYIQDSRTWN